MISRARKYGFTGSFAPFSYHIQRYQAICLEIRDALTNANRVKAGISTIQSGDIELISLTAPTLLLHSLGES